MKYKVTLIVPKMMSSFDTDDIVNIKKAWNKGKKICLEQHGKMFFYNLSKYNMMEIQKMDANSMEGEGK